MNWQEGGDTTKLKTFNKDISWEKLHSNNFISGQDYDEKFIFSVPGRVSGKKVTLIYAYYLHGLEILSCSGYCYKKWNDGELLSCEIFDLRNVIFFPAFGFLEEGWLHEKRRISELVFYKKIPTISSFYKATPAIDTKKLIADHPYPSKFILFEDLSARINKLHLDQGGIKAERYFSLKIPSLFRDTSEWLSFTEFFNALGERILLAEEYCKSEQELEFLSSPLQEGNDEVQIFEK